MIKSKRNYKIQDNLQVAIIRGGSPATPVAPPLHIKVSLLKKDDCDKYPTNTNF